ncbi:MAG: TolC family protein [Campylobacterales bacterium]
MRKKLLIAFFIISCLFAHNLSSEDSEIEEERELIDSAIFAINKGKTPYKDMDNKKKRSKISLKEAIELSNKSDFVLKQSSEKVIQMGHREDEARSAYYPQINADAGYKNKMEHPDNGGPNYYEEHNYGTEIRQTVFDGGIRSNSVDRFQRLKYSEKNKHSTKVMEQSQSVAEAYLGVVFDSQAVNINISNLKELDKILENVQIKVKSGAASNAEESSIVASYSDANKTLVTSKSKLIDSANYFEYITNLDALDNTPYQTKFPLKLKSFEDELEEVLANNPSLKSLQETIKSKQKELQAARGSYYPKVDLVTDYTESKSFGGGEGHKVDSSVGVELTYKIFDGFARESKISRIQSELSEAIYKAEQERKKIKWDLEQLYNSIVTLDETLQNSETELASREEMVQAYWDRFRLSTQDLEILLIAQKELSNIKLDRLRYLKNRTLDYFKLLSYKNKLIDYFDNIDEDTELKDDNSLINDSNSFYLHQSVIDIWEGENTDAPNRAVISVNVANMRKTPHIKKGNIIGKASRGDVFIIISKKGEWYRVTKPKESVQSSSTKLNIAPNHQNYLFIHKSTVGAYRDKNNPNRGVVAVYVNRANLRKSPEITHNNIVTTVKRGEKFNIISQNDEWYKIIKT